MADFTRRTDLALRADKSLAGAGSVIKTRIDLHAGLALLCLFLGLVPLAFYWLAFSAFGSSTLPWKIALTLELFCPTVVYLQYVMNRRSRRLFWEGIAAFISSIPSWMILGSYWLFYFGFAPIPLFTRVVALSVCFGITLVVIVRTWKNYRRAADRLGLVHMMPVIEPSTIVFPDNLGATISMFNRSAGSLPAPPMWLISLIGMIGSACAMLSGRVFETTGGPHILFIMLSVVSFPLSCLYIGHFFVRLAYFHIYIPLSLERKTGKKVILGS